MLEPGPASSSFIVRVLRRVGVAALLVALLAFTGLMLDVFDGFPFTRSAGSWRFWVGGLVLGGLFYAVCETGFEWITAGDRPGDPVITRVFRLLLGMSFVAAMIAAALAIIGFSHRLSS